MKKYRVAGVRVILGLALVLAVMPAGAETFKKLRSAVQTIVNSAEFNDTNEPTSLTVDLAGGDLDKCSFAVYASSAAGSSTLSLAVQISPDGGTSWIATGDTIAVSTSATSGAVVTAHSDDIKVSPGTKLRVVPTLASSTTYYHFKLYALPQVQ